MDEKDQKLIEDTEAEFAAFLEAEDTTHHLPPMNSYNRRLVHKLAEEFGFKTASDGEGDNRHVTITKAKESKKPKERQLGKVPVWNFGDREFIVDSYAGSVEVYLSKDGTIGAWVAGSNIPYIVKKAVTSGSFKIKANEIVEIQDANW